MAKTSAVYIHVNTTGHSVLAFRKLLYVGKVSVLKCINTKAAILLSVCKQRHLKHYCYNIITKWFKISILQSAFCPFALKI